MHTNRSALKPEIVVALQQHRDDIIEMYEERAAIMEYEGGLSREEAERGAQASISIPPKVSRIESPRR